MADESAGPPYARDGLYLAPQHIELLKASAIAPEVACERGYFTAVKQGEIANYGWHVAPFRAPVLMIPIRTVSGGLAFYLARPDNPRMVKGKIAKYELPPRVHMALDCHPRNRPYLADPSVPLVITEGSRKADAAVSAGLVCLALIGVWNWRGTNDAGGKTALPDWEIVALNGRTVYVCFDSDVMTKPEVYAALARLKGFLEHRGASVKLIYLPSGEHGQKVGLDDYLAQRHSKDELLALATAELRPCPTLDSLYLSADGKALVEAAVEKLARLKPADYNRVRRAEAERLGLNVGILDQAVKDWRRENGGKLLQGQPLDLAAPQPCEYPVDGAAVLEELAVLFKRHMVFTTPEQADAVALWVAHTYCFSEFDITPRLALSAPAMRCGKSRLLELVGLAACKGLTAANVSPAALYRTIDQYRPTLLLDEFDMVNPENGDLRSVINSGHSRACGYVIRVEGESNEPRKFATFAPLAVAQIGKPWATLADRSIEVSLRRRLKTEPIVPITQAVRDSLTELRSRLARFIHDAADKLKDADPQIPLGLDDRAADNWRSLIAIADAAGGQWPTRARTAACALSADRDGAESDLGIRLLADIAVIIEGDLRNVWSPEDLLEALKRLDDAPWSDLKDGKPLSRVRLGRLLKRFDVARVRQREGGTLAWCYRRADLEDAISRYVSTPPEKSGNTGTSTGGVGESANFDPGTDSGCSRIEKRSKPLRENTCSRVPGLNPGGGGEKDVEV